MHSILFTLLCVYTCSESACQKMAAKYGLLFMMSYSLFSIYVNMFFFFFFLFCFIICLIAASDILITVPFCPLYCVHSACGTEGSSPSAVKYSPRGRIHTSTRSPIGVRRTPSRELVSFGRHKLRRLSPTLSRTCKKHTRTHCVFILDFETGLLRLDYSISFNVSVNVHSEYYILQ